MVEAKSKIFFLTTKLPAPIKKDKWPKRKAALLTQHCF
jgi:hypothetical protein